MTRDEARKFLRLRRTFRLRERETQDALCRRIDDAARAYAFCGGRVALDAAREDYRAWILGYRERLARLRRETEFSPCPRCGLPRARFAVRDSRACPHCTALRRASRESEERARAGLVCARCHFANVPVEERTPLEGEHAVPRWLCPRCVASNKERETEARKIDVLRLFVEASDRREAGEALLPGGILRRAVESSGPLPGEGPAGDWVRATVLERGRGKPADLRRRLALRLLTLRDATLRRLASDLRAPEEEVADALREFQAAGAVLGAGPYRLSDEVYSELKSILGG